MAMHLGRLCGPVVLALAASAEAQERPASSECVGLAPDSFEAAVLNCDGAAEAMDSRQPPRVLEVLGPVTGDEPTRPAEVTIYGETSAGPAEPIPEGGGTVRVIGELSGVAAVSNPFGGGALAGDAEPSPRVPAGQRPPPGTCRVWFPDRHAGLQRPPTPCDVEVPVGAVLIQG